MVGCALRAPYFHPTIPAVHFPPDLSHVELLHVVRDAPTLLAKLLCVHSLGNTTTSRLHLLFIVNFQHVPARRRYAHVLFVHAESSCSAKILNA